MEASTLHSLLGISPNGVKFSQKRKLNAQAVIVDEASMVDIHIMYRLFDALSPVTKLILVGDKNQLPSVEAGALLGDFLEGYTQENHKMHNNIVVLTKSYRSQEGIRKLGELVINGDVSRC
jgi:exodeoxyribonuclease V alpha subunit